jgi:hypothetical protein
MRTGIIGTVRNNTPTGQIISASRNSNQNHSQVIDGFVKDPSKKSSQPSPKQRRPHVKSTQVHNRAQRAHTLMRGGLKNPVQKFTPSFQRFSSDDIKKEARAKSTAKHPHINRFGVPKPSPIPAPASQAVTGEIVNRDRSAKAAEVPAPLPSMVASASHQHLERLLDHALANADTHKEALRYHAARHFWQKKKIRGLSKWSALAILLVVIAAGLFLSWRKVPQFSVKAAGMRAHLNASVPSYIPEGYKMASPAKADSGTVAIEYVEHDNSQSYKIIQAQSNLTSSLVGRNVVPKGAEVQTSQVEGNTVYIYGQKNDAAWVNNGVLYTIKDQAGLSSDEIIKIVQGLNP